MCKLSPGPRCAKHTYDAMQAAQKRRYTCYVNAEEAAAHYDEIVFDPETTQEQRAEARSIMRKALDSLQKADERLLRAVGAYDSTPTGQRRLEESLANTNDEAEKAYLTERLETAKIERAKHMEAGRLQRDADKRMKKLDDVSKTELLKYKQAVDNAREVEELARRKLTESTRETARARGAKDESLKDMKYALNGVTAVNKEAHDYLTKAYQDAGVSKELAEHYATDTINANQNGWQFLGAEEDTSERVPRYNTENEYNVKVKGEGHPDHEATYRAKEKLDEDEKFQELNARVQYAQKVYQRSYEAAYEARHSFHAREGNMRRVAEEYKSKRDELRESTLNYDRFRAVKASQLDPSTTHRVTPKAFVSSAYMNPDGTTNAYVMVKYGDGTPYYAQVTSIGREEDGRGYVNLNNGTKIHAMDISSYDLVVVPPAKGADKLFGKS